MMPEGVTILSDKIQLPEVNAPASFIVIIFILALLVFLGLTIQVIHEDKKAHIGYYIAAVLMIMGVIGGSFGVYKLLSTREHEYKIMLTDEVPANWLTDNFKIRDKDGLIYTVLPLEDKWT